MTKQQLIESNTNLVYFVVNKYYPTYWYDDDIIQAGMLGLCIAADKWDADKGEFSTLAIICIRNAIVEEFRMRNKHNEVLSLDYKYNDDSTLSDTVVGDEDVEYVDFDSFYNTLQPMEKQIVDMKLSEKNNQEIANVMNCTRSNISRICRLLNSRWHIMNDVDDLEDNESD